VIAQSFIDGRPANCAVVCWRGKVLAGIAVEVISAQGSKGPATIVQVVQGTEMLAAAEKIARRLSLSGFFGLDFMIENKTGATYLIEMNPRCTPPCPLPLANQRNLAAAMLTQLTSQPLPEDQPVIKESIIAYFPQVRASVGELPDVNLRNSIYHDIPQGEPELIRELLHPKSERSMAGKLVDLSRRVWFQEKISKSCDFDGATPPQVAAIADPDGPV
jgi:predicted ATP-grasp superfamily ATP-dependent carboligase